MRLGLCLAPREAAGDLEDVRRAGGIQLQQLLWLQAARHLAPYAGATGPQQPPVHAPRVVELKHTQRNSSIGQVQNRKAVSRIVAALQLPEPREQQGRDHKSPCHAHHYCCLCAEQWQRHCGGSLVNVGCSQHSNSHCACSFGVLHGSAVTATSEAMGSEGLAVGKCFRCIVVRHVGLQEAACTLDNLLGALSILRSLHHLDLARPYIPEESEVAQGLGPGLGAPKDKLRRGDKDGVHRAPRHRDAHEQGRGADPAARGRAARHLLQSLIAGAFHHARDGVACDLSAQKLTRRWLIPLLALVGHREDTSGPRCRVPPTEAPGGQFKAVVGRHPGPRLCRDVFPPRVVVRVAKPG
mmetsp:Transcript_44946/g.139044  ORF Transcript_44946/g.139044 Transcript_44946/m.139044 type:complete len:354 (-) Transcript_44946:261-1322(-)